MPPLLRHQNPLHHPARSNRHHLQQPHKEPTPQPRSYWSHSTHEKWSLHAIRIATKTIQMRQTLNTTLTNIWASNTPGGVQTSASQPPDPHWKAFPNLILQVGFCVSALHWAVQNTKQHLFLIHAIAKVFTLSAFIYFFLFFSTPGKRKGKDRRLRNRYSRNC